MKTQLTKICRTQESSACRELAAVYSWDCPAQPCSSSSFFDLRARCLFRSDKGTSFPCRTPASSRRRPVHTYAGSTPSSWVQAVCVGSLWSVTTPLYIHYSCSTARLVDFKFQHHQLQRQQPSRDCKPAPISAKSLIPVTD